MVINRKEAEDLIIKTYHQFSEPLFRLNELYSKNDIPEVIKINEMYKEYLDSIGAGPEEMKSEEKIKEYLEPELKKTDDKELLDTLLECKNLAEAYKLPVKGEMPDDSVIEKNISYSVLSEIAKNLKQEEAYNNMLPFGNITPPLFNNTRPVITLLRVPLDRGASHALKQLPGILDIAVTEKQHKERNKYQCQCAPPNRYVMEVFRRMGLFGCWGPTGTHNLNVGVPDTKEQRLFNFLFNNFSSQGENYDYRGKGNIFRGMQFIYRHPKKDTLQSMELKNLLKKCTEEEIEDDIIIDRINIGTYDYVSPYDDSVMHGRYDVYPWIEWGNELAYYKPDIIMPNMVLIKVKYIFQNLLEDHITIGEARDQVEKVVPCPPKPNLIVRR